MLLEFHMSNSRRKLPLARVADRQWGRVKWEQIEALGIARATVSNWLKQGYLHRRLPRVYAVGHISTSIEARIAEALLYAGPGAMLSHTTAAWWYGLLDEHPNTIHISTPHCRRSHAGIRVHARRDCERVWHRGFPLTPLPQLFLDLAASTSLNTVRRALAAADYKRILDAEAIERHAGPGRTGSKRLRQALESHQPALARTKSELERMFLAICEQQGWPTPDVNEFIAGWEVDVLWRDERIAIELDGHGNHHTPAQRRRDRRKDLALRKAGYTPVRYSEEQLEQQSDLIEDVAGLRTASSRAHPASATAPPPHGSKALHRPPR
jgi:hypothetical protein